MNTWLRFKNAYTYHSTLELAVDLSRVDFAEGFFPSMQPRIAQAFAAMNALESGAIANPDEDRRVGHYWLRAPDLAPERAIQREIEDTIEAIKAFARDVHSGLLQGARGVFKNVLVIGIGGSALGPQFVARALGHPRTDKMRLEFFDNTDPDGMERVLAALAAELGQTLCIVISKSGGTKETENGMKEAREAYTRAGLPFAPHAVAITMAGSKLAKIAEADGWLRQFPIWDWVGGRTSQTSAVGLLPAALQGLDIDRLLAGAKACDAATRVQEVPADPVALLQAVRENPAALLALTWYALGNGRGEKDMVVIPYKDRLELFSRYLQQLIMESLGKKLDLDGNEVHQGLAVYGNKGSTDQHAYIQQLRDGLNNFFVLFIEVLRDQPGASFEVEPGVTSGDYLSGFLLGTRSALHDSQRQSLTLTVREVSPFSVGVLIALFERAVGLYAQLIHINAYHQPGVQAGKVAAENVLKLQAAVRHYLAGYAAAKRGRPATAEQIAQALGPDADAETVFKICEHLAANEKRGVRRVSGCLPGDAAYAGE